VSHIGRMFNIFCPSIPYTLMDTSLRHSNFVTSFNVIGNSIFKKFSTIYIYSVGRKIRVSFDWVQRGDHRPCEACIVHRSHVNHRSLCHYLFGATSHAHWITLINVYCKIQDSRQRPPTVTWVKLLETSREMPMWVR